MVRICDNGPGWEQVFALFSVTMHKKWNFSLRISSVNVTKSAFIFLYSIIRFSSAAFRFGSIHASFLCRKIELKNLFFCKIKGRQHASYTKIFQGLYLGFKFPCFQNASRWPYLLKTLTWFNSTVNSKRNV